MAACVRALCTTSTARFAGLSQRRTQTAPNQLAVSVRLCFSVPPVHPRLRNLSPQPPLPLERREHRSLGVADDREAAGAGDRLWADHQVRAERLRAADGRIEIGHLE